jgi:signal transduction histidine kinase
MGWVRRELAAAADQSDSALLDNMPKIIDALAQVLDGGEGGTAYSQELFALHAEARVDWSSYSADEILREYVLLRKAVFQVLESQQPLSGAERDTILEFIDRGVLAGSARITALQRVQAQLELQYLKLIEHLVVESGKADGVGAGLERLLEVILKGLGAEAAAFFLYREETLEVTLSSAAASSVPLADTYRAAFALSAARAQQSYEADKAHVVDVKDLEPAARESLSRLGLELLVLVKISPRARVPGTLCIGFRNHRAFDPVELRLLAALGDRVTLLLASLQLQEESISALERLRLQTDMLEADRNSLDEERRRRDEIIAAVSHDLKNPLSTAKLGAELIRRGPATPDMTERLANQILASISRSDKMIVDLLDCQHIQAGKQLPMQMEAYRMNDLVDTVVEEMARLHGDRFIVRAEPDVAGFWSWEGMRRALENLLSNAVKYSAPRSPITICLAVSEGNRMRMSVHNEGAPLSPEEQARVFQPFERGKSAQRSGQRGWGIGLTLVRGIVDAHGGAITVESTAEGGTTFTIRNPMDSRPYQEAQVG